MVKFKENGDFTKVGLGFGTHAIFGQGKLFTVKITKTKLLPFFLFKLYSYDYLTY